MNQQHTADGDPAFGWMDSAACAGVGPDLFYSPDADDTAPGLSTGWDTTLAKAICLNCPVWQACRIVGLAEEHGVWGGMTARDRVKVRAATGLSRTADGARIPMDEVRARVVGAMRAAHSDPTDAADRIGVGAHPMVVDFWADPARGGAA